jgi:hypothetical protein
MRQTFYLLLSLLALASVEACGKTMPTAPDFSRSQIIGPCYVYATLTTRDGVTVYASAFYTVCPPLALVDSLGEKESVTKP